MATGNIDQQDTMEAFDDYNSYSEEDDEPGMTLVEHLEELRWRIFKMLIAVVVGSIVAFIFLNHIIAFLEAPLPLSANVLDSSTHHPLVVVGLTEGFTTYLIVSIVCGIVLSLPVLLYQVWAFIVPGLYEHEKKAAVPFIFIGLALFVAGVTLAYLTLRFPITWLVDFASDRFVPLVTADSYFQFVAIFLLVFGLIFELPLVLTFMAKVGLVSKETLVRKRSTAHIGMWVAATFLTPGTDLYTPIILGTAMSVLYELTIIFIHRFVKPDVPNALEDYV